MPPATTFHLVPRLEWESSDPAAPYVPAAFERDGFVHCTDGADEVAATANRHFSAFSGELCALVVDRSRLGAEVRYEDQGGIYPHVYGPIERAAILRIVPMPRAAGGEFLPPTE